MNTFSHIGNRLTYANTSGSLIASGTMTVLTSGAAGKVGIPVTNIANNASGEMAITGVHTYAALSTDTGAIGAVVYLDVTNNRLTTTSTSNTLAGWLASPKTSGQTTADVLLNGLAGSN